MFASSLQSPPQQSPPNTAPPPRLDEATLLATLRTLAGASPEVRALLRDIAAAVEDLREFDALRTSQR